MLSLGMRNLFDKLAGMTFTLRDYRLARTLVAADMDTQHRRDQIATAPTLQDDLEVRARKLRIETSFPALTAITNKAALAHFVRTRRHLGRRTRTGVAQCTSGSFQQLDPDSRSGSPCFL